MTAHYLEVRLSKEIMPAFMPRPDKCPYSGIYQNGSLTHQRLYDMCPLFLVFSPPNVPWYIFTLNDDGSTCQQLARNTMNVTPGRYIILGPGMFCFDLLLKQPNEKADGAPVSVAPSADSYPRRILSRDGSVGLTPRVTYYSILVTLALALLK